MSKKKDNVINLPNVMDTHQSAALAFTNILKNKRQLIEKTTKTLLKALDLKDHYTFGHSMRVAFYSLQLGHEIGLSENELYTLEMAALFHDIGKIGVPDSVLLKPTRLDDSEFMKMKLHPEHSYEILKDFSELELIGKFAKHHHERYDGRGYPAGLKSEEIPLYSRIILIADTFDAMTSTRPYRKGLPYEVAYSELLEFAGSQFDPELVTSFINAMKKDQSKKEATFRLAIMGENYNKEAA